MTTNLSTTPEGGTVAAGTPAVMPRLEPRPTHRDGDDAAVDAAAEAATGRIEIDEPVRVLRRLPGGPGRLDDDPAARDHGDHRAVRLRQEHVPALAQPDARADRGRADRGRAPPRRREPVRRERRPGPAAPDHRHGLPAAEPVPDDVDLRQRRRGPAADGPAAAHGARRHGRALPAHRRRCGTRSRTSSSSRERRCPAGSSSGCASPGPWRSTPRCSSWTSPRPRSTRSRRSGSRS